MCLMKGTTLGSVYRATWVWNLRAEISLFCEKKGKDIPKVSDADWKTNRALTVDVTEMWLSELML